MTTIFITRSIVPHLDFTETISADNKYIFANIEENEKYITLYQFAINQINQNADFIWPTSVTVTRNNNYVHSITGVNAKVENFLPPVYIDCNTNWTITFDNYNSNTKIHLSGLVHEPSGRNVNY